MRTESIYTHVTEDSCIGAAADAKLSEAEQSIRMISRSPSEFPPLAIDFLVEPEICNKKLHLVTGVSGHGKSYLLLKWCRDIALANPDRDVLYLDRENTLEDIQGRIKKCGGIPGNFKYWGGWHLRDAPDVDSDLLLEVAEKLRDPIIVVDTYAAFSKGTENSNDDVTAFFKPLRRFVHRGWTVIVIHNIGKGGDNSRGASSFKDNVDVALRIDAKFDQDGNIETLNVSGFKRRSGGMKPQHYNMVNGVLIRQGTRGSELPGSDDLMEWFGRNQGLTQEPLAERAKKDLNIGRDKIISYINQQKAAGLIEVRKDYKLYLKTQPSENEPAVLVQGDQSEDDTEISNGERVS
jgi:hypothetical protein